jgi:hypothetical protein
VKSRRPPPGQAREATSNSIDNQQTFQNNASREGRHHRRCHRSTKTMPQARGRHHKRHHRSTNMVKAFTRKAYRKEENKGKNDAFKKVNGARGRCHHWPASGSKTFAVTPFPPISRRKGQWQGRLAEAAVDRPGAPKAGHQGEAGPSPQRTTTDRRRPMT